MSMASKKHNALKHGANAKEVMLWDERREDYESLRVGLNREYTPDGTTEEYLVQAILDLLWRRRRLDRHGQITTQKRLDEIFEANETSSHIEVLHSLAPEFNEATTAEKVEATLARLEPIYRNTILRDWPLQTGGDANAWGPKIAAGLLTFKAGPSRGGDDAFLAIIDLDALDISLARIERLDAMIDRTIKRLMQVKTMKQMHGRFEPKLINLSATKNLPVQDGTDNRSAH
jgi:hypothetical protein